MEETQHLMGQLAIKCWSTEQEFYFSQARFTRYLCCVLLLKMKVKVKFSIEQTTTAQRGTRCTDLHFLNLGAKWRWSTPNPKHVERPGTLCIGGWWAPGPVWTGAENLGPYHNRLHGDRNCISQAAERCLTAEPWTIIIIRCLLI
jgi:hypothetical protein